VEVHGRGWPGRDGDRSAAELLGLVEELVLEVERLVRAELDVGGAGRQRGGGDVAGRHDVLEKSVGVSVKEVKVRRV
jgi:hypothetical protein